jgi:hypothetical protein
MPDKDEPQSGPVGNTDPSKRGRNVGRTNEPGGKPGGKRSGDADKGGDSTKSK